MKKLTLNDKKIRIEEAVIQIMKALELDLTDASLKDTPKRVAKMYVDETFAGLHTAPPKFTTFPNKNYDQILLIKDITVNSYCEHHLVPFIGKCHIAYLPGKRYAGLSKFNRVAQYFAARPQVQERLGTNILEFLQDALKTENVAVIIDCKHFCVCTRGIKDPNSSTISSHLGGIFKDATARKELFDLLTI